MTELKKESCQDDGLLGAHLSGAVVLACCVLAMLFWRFVPLHPAWLKGMLVLLLFGVSGWLAWLAYGSVKQTLELNEEGIILRRPFQKTKQLAWKDIARWEQSDFRQQVRLFD